MIQWHEASKKGGYLKVPEVNSTKIRFRWHGRWYDGPLDGMCIFEGKKYWFSEGEQLDEFTRDRIDSCGEQVRDYFRRYFLIELTADQLEEKEHWHKLSAEMGGIGSEYDETTQRWARTPNPNVSKEASANYFEMVANAKPTDLSRNTVVGWFEFLWGTLDKDEIPK